MHLSDKSVLIKRIHALFKGEKRSLSIAESCTGGLIASMITDMPGASEFLDSGIVCYSHVSKTHLLSVRQSTLKQSGMVSEETARQMAEGMRRLRKTDFSLSVTGNLGPSSLEGKDIGLVYFAVASQENTFSKGMRFTGTRLQIKRQTALYGLEFLIQVLGL